MATAAKIGPQDLPPPGGYRPIQTERVRLRALVGFKFGVGLFITTQVIGYIGWGHTYRMKKREQIELRSARFALQAPLIAERDRAMLKQVRKNRDEEAELMKDYPGWEVGTYFGEKVFQTAPDDQFIEPQFNEYTVHAPIEGTWMLRNYMRHLT